jgi:hypothetical protein
MTSRFLRRTTNNTLSQKTPEEKSALTEDMNHDSFSILGDKAYDGAPSTTEGIRHVFVKRFPRNQLQVCINNKLSSIRCPVEMFFGRMKNLFKFAAITYRLDHAKFDMHMNNIILLTNENIKRENLTEEDITFHREMIKKRVQEYEDRLMKKKLKTAFMLQEKRLDMNERERRTYLQTNIHDFNPNKKSSFHHPIIQLKKRCGKIQR